MKLIRSHTTSARESLSETDSAACPSRAKRIWLTLVGCALATLAASLLITFSQGHIAPREVLLGIARGTTYAIGCGGLMFATMPRVWRALGRLSFPAQFAAYLVAVLVVTVPGALLANLLAAATGLLPWSHYWRAVAGGLPIAAVLSLIFGTGFVLWGRTQTELAHARTRIKQQELEREQALRAATEARLASLESHLQPHFLFNTLNSISSLTAADPEKAETMIERLAALLRFSLDADQRGLVPLEEELKVVRDYLEIERTRFGQRLRYSTPAPGEGEGLEIPPLAVQTLVENSVKYAVATRAEGGSIRVEFRREGERLSVAVADDGPGFSADDIKPGHGLDNLQQRLKTLFGAEASLEIAGGRVSLELPAAKPVATV